MSSTFDQGCPRCESFHYQTEILRKPNTLCELCRRDKARESLAAGAEQLRKAGMSMEEATKAIAKAFKQGGIDQ